MDRPHENPGVDREPITVVPVWTMVAEPALLRHDLLTPVNHLLGYAELLLEEAEALGRHELLPGLTRLLGHSRDVLSRLDAVLGRDEPRALAVARLREALDRIVVEGAILRVLVGPDQEVFDADLEKIRGAAQRLRGLVDAAFGDRPVAASA